MDFMDKVDGMDLMDSVHCVYFVDLVIPARPTLLFPSRFPTNVVPQPI